MNIICIYKEKEAINLRRIREDMRRISENGENDVNIVQIYSIKRNSLKLHNKNKNYEKLLIYMHY